MLLVPGRSFPLPTEGAPKSLPSGGDRDMPHSARISVDFPRLFELGWRCVLRKPGTILPRIVFSSHASTSGESLVHLYQCRFGD